MEFKRIESSFQKCVSWNLIRNTLILREEIPIGGLAVLIGLSTPILNSHFNLYFVLGLIQIN